MAFNFSRLCNGTDFGIVPHRNDLVIFRRVERISCSHLLIDLAKALRVVGLEVSIGSEAEWVRVEAKNLRGEPVNFIVLAASIVDQIFGCRAEYGDTFSVTNGFDLADDDLEAE